MEADMPQVSTLIDITVAETIDDLCGQILEAQYAGRRLASVHLAPKAYALIADAKRKQTGRGNPILLLGLPIVSDDSLTADHPAVASER
jgi:hypothetical protein